MIFLTVKYIRKTPAEVNEQLKLMNNLAREQMEEKEQQKKYIKNKIKMCNNEGLLFGGFGAIPDEFEHLENKDSRTTQILTTCLGSCVDML